MLTVEEVWRASLPAGTRLVAGRNSIDREVVWAVTLRSAAPGFAGLRGGEIALISTNVLRQLDERLTLARALEILSESSISAAAVTGEAPPEAIRRADELGIPLFVLPSGSSPADVEQSVNRLISERASGAYQREQEKYRQLTELAIDGRGLPAIVVKLDEITGKLVVVEDEQHRVIAVSRRLGGRDQQDLNSLLAATSAEIAPWLKSLRRSSTDPPAARFASPDSSLARVVSPITVRNATAGFVSIVGDKSTVLESDRTAAARGSVASAIELSRQRAIAEAREASETALVEELLGSGSQREQRIVDRAGREGFDESEPHAVVVFAFDPLPDSLAVLGGEAAKAHQRGIESEVKKELNRRNLRAPLQSSPDRLTIIYPLPTGRVETLKEFAASIGKVVAAHSDGYQISAGAGTPQPGLAGLRASSKEAGQALAVATKMAVSGQVIYFGDLSLYRLLNSLRKNEDVRSFADEVLGRLAAYDAETKSDLVPTLEAYCDSLYSVSEAARRLQVHRNTMLYRLNRIREITSLDLDDPDTLLSLHLALKIIRIPEGED